MIQTADNDKAFNAGADARLRGEPISANPYPPGDRAHRLYRMGWFEVASHYAAWVKGRWPVRKLPPVRPERGGPAAEAETEAEAEPEPVPAVQPAA